MRMGHPGFLRFQKEKPGLRRAFGLRFGESHSSQRRACMGHPGLLLAGSHFFGFAFLAHLFELALGFFPGGLDFLLDFGCRFLELR